MTANADERPHEGTPLLSQLIAIGIGAVLAIVVFIAAGASSVGEQDDGARRPPATGGCEVSTSLEAMPQADVIRLQTRLKELGLYDKSIDGRAGPVTRAAVAAWAARLGVQPPVWGPALCAKTAFGDGEPGP